MSHYQVPTGAILPFAGTVAPSGYLFCNGAAVSRTTYAKLFAVIGVSHGYGDNSTTFNIPDYRGRFLRGVDGGTARDPNRATRTAMNTGGNTGDAVGTLQGQATAKNGLALSDPGHKHYAGPDSAQFVGTGTGSGANLGAGGGYVIKVETSPNTTNITLGNGDAETRPINANVNWIIKI